MARDYMVDLRIQLADAGRTVEDDSFYAYFVDSLPNTLDLFITLYKDDTYDVELLCDTFAEYEMRKQTRAEKSGKTEAAAGGLMSLVLITTSPISTISTRVRPTT